MNQGVGYVCPKCKEMLFGIAWHQGIRFMYSNCLCGGENHQRLIPLEKAIQFLGSEMTEEETKEKNAQESAEVTVVH